jgi:hypothetical protein
MVIAYGAFGLRCGHYAALDPVMDHPEADAISLTNLTNSKGSGRRQGAGDTVLVANPTYHFEPEWFAGGAGQTFTVEQFDDLSVVIHFSHITDFSNERIWIADRILSLWALTYLEYLSCSTLPANLQAQQPWFWVLDDGNVAD